MTTASVIPATEHVYPTDASADSYHRRRITIDPLIPEGCYRAPPQSLWNTAEFLAIFAPDRAVVIVLL